MTTGTSTQTHKARLHTCASMKDKKWKFGVLILVDLDSALMDKHLLDYLSHLRVKFFKYERSFIVSNSKLTR